MFRHIQKTVLSFLVILFSSISIADDIDIIGAEQLAYDANVLFIMDVSGSMGWPLSDGIVSETNPSRISVLRDALSALLVDPEVSGINFGLSSFAGYSSTANGISYPVAPIESIADVVLDRNPLFDHPSTSALPPTTGPEQTTGSYLNTIANTWVPGGGTPIVDALFEGALYFRGLPTNWGRHDPSKNRAAHPSTYTGLLKDTIQVIQGEVCNTLPCTGDSCNETKTCNIGNDVATCSTPTCGDVCTEGENIRETCAEGVTSCGLGENCTGGVTKTVKRNCLTNSTGLCRLVHPTWYDCKTRKSTKCKLVCPHNDRFYDFDGDEWNCEDPINQCSEVKHKQCKEDIEVTTCDAKSFSCTTESEQCTHDVCEINTTSTTVLEGEAVFVSPIDEECPANGIILLSDGSPNSNYNADLISTMIGSANSNNCDSSSDDGGRCGKELVKFIATNDNSITVPGKQFVNTFTVGLSIANNNTAEQFLKELAAAGEGEFINATNPEDLVEAFKLAIDGIAGAKARSFAPPTYAIDTSNLLSNDDEIYVPIFDRKGVVWPGNLKKFKIENGVIKDANGDPATNTIGGLLSTAKDLWAPLGSVSEDSVRSGGAANQLNPNTRQIYTDDNTTLIKLDISIENSAFDDGSAAVPVDDEEKSKLVTFIKGTNPDTDEVRHHMGDIIHSKPIKLNRATGNDTIFVGSNEGYLHAFNDNDGKEAFAYMPRELLINISNQYHQIIDSGNHIYGVDGPITLWIDERNSKKQHIGNNILDANEKAYLFFGLRRGGQLYFALDVTHPTNPPTLVWKKSFGDGQSWSQPVLKNLQWSDSQDEPEPVLIIGGGHEDGTTKGNAVYIVAAVDSKFTAHKAGDVIWSTKSAESDTNKIENSIPSRVRVIDIDRNGSIDTLYFGDTGGNIWRVDLTASQYESVINTSIDISKAKLYKLATLGGSGVNDRKFYEEPDVAVFKQKGILVATIAIGSGDRTNPLGADVEDKFFVLYDKDLMKAPDINNMISISNGLKDSEQVKKEDIGTKEFRGWFKDLGNTTGEKVLATALTYQNKVLFTTFGTISVTPDACNPSNTTQGRLYIMDLISGKVYTNVEAASGEILGKPQIIFGSLTNKAGDGPCVDGDCVREHKVRVGKMGPFAVPNAGAFQNDTIDPNTGLLIPDPDAVDAVMFPRVYWLDSEDN